MKECFFLLEIIVFTLFLLLLQGDALKISSTLKKGGRLLTEDIGQPSNTYKIKLDGPRQNGFCSWTTYKNSSCPRSKFLCNNGQCIERTLHCNGRYDCRDNSDETYCNDYNCPSGRKVCPGYRKCILEEWFCDGVRDCPDGRDENSCDGKRGSELFAMSKAVRWLTNQYRKSESATKMWGYNVDRAAVALYLAGNQTKNASREFIKELAYETSIQLLSRLSKKKLQDIPSEDLAPYVNTFLVTCLDPRNFHGVDIVQELRTRVDQQDNYTNPFVLLALCNAGEIITEKDKVKLIDIFWAKHRAFWTDIQAGVLMALACANQQPGNGMQVLLKELAMELKQYQYRNGTVENFQTTALVMQALMAAEKDSDPDNFDDMRALEQMLAMQKEDGSFGSLTNTYYVLPVLNCRTLVNISKDHCDPVPRDEITALDDLSNRSGPKVRVQYSIWIGDEKDLERNLALRVPSNTSFYGVMEIAADLDSRFRFEYTVKNRKPYVNALSGLQNDPEIGKFWSLYKVVEGKPTPSQESPADVKLKGNDHFAMWYRSGSWVN